MRASKIKDLSGGHYSSRKGVLSKKKGSHMKKMSFAEKLALQKSSRTSADRYPFTVYLRGRANIKNFEKWAMKLEYRFHSKFGEALIVSGLDRLEQESGG